ncbi:metallo-beta-lactamase domain-containing protein 1 [Agrilus planipennis]|uniref:Metallo-beta-lactamase domain-containing protein 1 n=1 Tax=Agrilus planipennis TaxID=224129 RepID=A0A1W4XTS7_AGRPL|nr:metallo-beta-lactamase domain-containing protein 1 [Agrilus planipennis]
MNNTKLTVLFEGYSDLVENGMNANSSCTLLTGQKNVIIDTMTAWDGEKLIVRLKELNLSCSDIDYVVCTHGHSDHIGCNYLFLNATHIVGFSVSHKDFYHNVDFNTQLEYKLGEYVKVVPTPGHTLQDVSVIAKVPDLGTVAITGDLFENENDLNDESIWISAGSDSQELQRKNRNFILSLADWIVPGHGPMFKVKNVNELNIK